METIALKSNLRKETGKQINSSRKQGKLPAVLYGHKIKNKNLWLDYLDFQKAYEQAGGSTLIDLTVDNGKPVKVLAQDIQQDPVTGQFIHIDFHQVRMDEKITTEIAINFIGESPAEKEQGGILVKNFDEVKVECLPQYLVHEITVDVSILKTFEDEIKIKDLSLPQEIQVMDVAEEIVVHVLPPKTEEELQKELEEGIETKVEDVEVEEKSKEEDDEKEGDETEDKAEKGEKEKGKKKDE